MLGIARIHVGMTLREPSFMGSIRGVIFLCSASCRLSRGLSSRLGRISRMTIGWLPRVLRSCLSRPGVPIARSLGIALGRLLLC